MQEFKTVEVTTDLLIMGAGMSGTGAAVEGAHWAKENNIKLTIVDKAAMERSGAVAMGLSAINQYQGDNTPIDYLSYVRLVRYQNDRLAFGVEPLQQLHDLLARG